MTVCSAEGLLEIQLLSDLTDLVSVDKHGGQVMEDR
jgi:hypothetical protein